MTPRRARYSKVRVLSEQVLRRRGVTGPAVPIEDIVAAEGIEVRQGELGEVSGLIARTDGKVVIGLNKLQARVRRRFTLAHEYGHYLLHEGIRTHADTDFRVNYRDRTSSEATFVEEIEANYFAACLLMPRAFLDKMDADAALDSDRRVEALARAFDVSRHAMSLRLVKEYAKYRPY